MFSPLYEYRGHVGFGDRVLCIPHERENILVTTQSQDTITMLLKNGWSEKGKSIYRAPELVLCDLFNPRSLSYLSIQARAAVFLTCQNMMRTGELDALLTALSREHLHACVLDSEQDYSEIRMALSSSHSACAVAAQVIGFLLGSQEYLLKREEMSELLPWKPTQDVNSKKERTDRLSKDARDFADTLTRFSHTMQVSWYTGLAIRGLAGLLPTQCKYVFVAKAGIPFAVGMVADGVPSSAVGVIEWHQTGTQAANGICWNLSPHDGETYVIDASQTGRTIDAVCNHIRAWYQNLRPIALYPRSKESLHRIPTSVVLNSLLEDSPSVFERYPNEHWQIGLIKQALGLNDIQDDSERNGVSYAQQP